MMRLNKKRRIQGKTNYTKRRRLLEARKPRIVIRKSNKYITLQYIETKIAQDSITASASSSELREYGWPNNKSCKSLGAAYITGFLFGKKISGKSGMILDTGLIRSTKGSKVYSAIKGMIDAGVKISCKKEMFPDESRIKSQDIAEIFDKVKAKIEGGQK